MGQSVCRSCDERAISNNYFLARISTRDKTSSRGKLGCKLVAILYKYPGKVQCISMVTSTCHLPILANGTTIPKHGQNPSVSAANALWTNAYEGKFKPTACYPIMYVISHYLFSLIIKSWFIFRELLAVDCLPVQVECELHFRVVEVPE